MYPQASRVQGSGPLVARTAPQRVLAFALDRVTAGGLEREWQAARLAFVEGAGEGADVFDGGLPRAIGPAGARIGFAATGADGQTVYRGQESRAYGLAAFAKARLALAAPVAGTFRPSWPMLADLLADWELMLTDGGTGAQTDRRTADYVDFTAAAGDWTSRFHRARRAAHNGCGRRAGRGRPLRRHAQPDGRHGTARVALAVAQTQHVRAELFDALGRRVAVVLDGVVEAPRDLLVETRGLAPGVYVLRVTGDTFAASRQITVTR